MANGASIDAIIGPMIAAGRTDGTGRTPAAAPECQSASGVR